MTNKEKEILHYLISNSNDKGEISISDKDLADNCGTTTTTIRTFKNKAQKENIFKYENKKYIIPNDIKVDYSYIVDDVVKNKDLKYSTTEKNVLGYITDRNNSFQDDNGYTYSTLEYIGKECGITNKAKLIKILNKLVADGLIDMIKGDYSKRQATKFKVLFGSNNNITITPKTNNIDNTTINSNNNININIPDNSEVITLLKQLNGRIDKLETLYQDLKNSLIRQAEKIGNLETEIIRINQRLDNMEYIITSHDE